MFYIKTGRYVPLKIDYVQTVKHGVHNFDIDLMKPSVYIWIKALDFCIPMISHCMIEGFGPVHGRKDPIKVINVCNKDIEKKRITISIGLNLENYLYFFVHRRKCSMKNYNSSLFEINE